MLPRDVIAKAQNPREYPLPRLLALWTLSSLEGCSQNLHVRNDVVTGSKYPAGGAVPAWRTTPSDYDELRIALVELENEFIPGSPQRDVGEH